MLYFIQGLTLGLAYVAPIGVQNLFIINSALRLKRIRAYQTALIVIFFDVTLALACFFGIGALMDLFPLLKMGILLVGSLIVLWIGISLIRSKVSMDKEAEVNMPILKVIATACVVTWFNPQALIDGTMLLGAFRATLPPEHSSIFILGVAAASCLWFLGLSTITSILKHQFTVKVLRTINIICGFIIVFYGLKLAWSFYLAL